MVWGPFRSRFLPILEPKGVFRSLFLCIYCIYKLSKPLLVPNEWKLEWEGVLMICKCSKYREIGLWKTLFLAKYALKTTPKWLPNHAWRIENGPLDSLSHWRPLFMGFGYFHTFRDAKAFNTSLQLNGHHKSKQKRDLLCSVLHATEKFHLH